MITEIFVEGKRIDLSADISSLLSFALDDIKDFSARSTVWSKTIVIPGTANNNAVFGNIFDVSIANEYNETLDNIGYNFNAAKSAKCFVFQDFLQTFKGSIRLLEIIKDKNRIEYEVALNGELTGLSVALSTGFLHDLDFSDYDFVWTASAIEASWSVTPGSGVFMPLMDYGNYSVNKHNWDFRTCRPALFVKEYIDKMFEAAGFTYEAPMFDTARFKRLIIPHNQKVLLTQISEALEASFTTEQPMLNSTMGTLSNKPDWTTIIGGGFTYLSGVFTYTQPTTLTATINFSIGGQRVSSTAGSFRVHVRKNGVSIKSHDEVVFPIPGIGWRWNDFVNLTVATGDTIDFYLEYLSGTDVVVSVLNSDFVLESDVPTYQPADLGSDIHVNDAIPRNIRQVDFLLSIVKLFNLYIQESQFDERKMIISSFIHFYSGETVDWTYKLNRDTVIKVKPLSEVNSKIYDFNYRSDSDFHNDLYRKRYNQGYGDHTYDSQFEFASQTNKLELIFAATPLVGYDGEDKLYSTIFKRTGNTTLVEENVDSVIRILQSALIADVTTWALMDGVDALSTHTTYGYAGHFDDPDAPENDLNFGILEELFFIFVSGNLQNTQFNVYWSGYMNEITHKDAKMVIAKFYLTAKDIFSLDFKKFVWLDGTLFRLNKIIDYNISNPSDCTVELLNVISQSFGFPPGGDILEEYALLWTDNDPILWDGTEEIVYKD